MEIYFWYRKSTVSAEHGTISCVIKIDGIEAAPFSTKIKTEKKHWNAKEQCFEGKNSATKEIVKENIITALTIIHRKLLAKKNGEQILPEEIRERFLEGKKNVPKKQLTYLELVDNYIEFQKKLYDTNIISENTYKTYIVRRNVLYRFLEERKNLKLSCKNFDAKMLDEIQDWLRLRGHENGYIYLIGNFIKQLHKYALKKNLIKKNVLENCDVIKYKEKIPVVLEPQELQQILDYKFEGVLERVVDAWIFCQETSLSYCDFMRVKNSDLKKDMDGIIWIEMNRKKTDELHQIPLSNRALEIIEKYDSSIENIPKFKPNAANRWLKIIAKKCNIDKTLKWHTSRKTFANNNLNYKGMREVTLAKIMGWSSTKPLKIYARINKNAIVKEFFV